MEAIKKYLIILTIAILYTIFVQTFAEAFTEDTDLDCYEVRSPKLETTEEDTAAMNECYEDERELRGAQNRIVFIVSNIVGLLTIFAALFISYRSDLVNWASTGFILGSLLSIFIGTMRYFSDLDKIARPIVIFLEIVLVLFVAYRYMRKK